MLARAEPARRPALAAALIALLVPAVSSVVAATIERIEPPHWWVGMREPTLELMVHGDRIAAARVDVDDPRVRLVGTSRLESPNYLFVRLSVKADAAPGELALAFVVDGQRSVKTYRLEARRPGSARRVGFGPGDAILNLMPDRFANGDPSNDTLPGFSDRADRRDPKARHGGDLIGLRRALDYIAAMGYTMIWSTPVLENNQPEFSYHGYAVTDQYRVDARLGSNEDYRELVADARRRGIGIIMDLIPNHVGSAHWWLKDPPSPDWITNDGRYVPVRHLRSALADPYAAAVDRENFTDGWFVESMPDLNQELPQLATYLVQNAIWWIEFADLAGLRIDTYGYCDPRFLADWSRRVMAEYPHFSIVGEEWSGNPILVSRWQRGKVNWDGLVSHTPSMMDFPVSEALRRALVTADSPDRGLPEFYAQFAADPLYPDPDRLVVFEGNHDMARIFSVLDEDFDLWRMAMVLVATTRGIPQFYYGTEVLMTSPKERDDLAARRDFPGGWQGDPVDAFTGRGLSPRQREAQAYLRRLLNWRKATPTVQRGRLMHYAPLDGVYVWFRYDAERTLMMAINKGGAAATLDPVRYRERLDGAIEAEEVFDGRRLDLKQRFTLPPRSVGIYAVRFADDSR